MQYNEITGKNMAFISHKEVADLGLPIENLAHDSRLWPTTDALWLFAEFLLYSIVHIKYLHVHICIYYLQYI